LPWPTYYFAGRVTDVIRRHNIERQWTALNEETGGMNHVLYQLYTITVRLLCISIGNRKTPSLFMQNDQSHLVGFLNSDAFMKSKLKGYGMATLAQNKIFPAKQELMLSEITGLPLDAQMQRNRLDVDERAEVVGSAVAHVHLVLHVRFVLVLQT
jgi:hypothetical protein